MLVCANGGAVLSLPCASIDGIDFLMRAYNRSHSVYFPCISPQSLVRANGGAVLSLRAGDIMFMPPRVFHLARNVETTVSCNFSLVSMDDVPDMLLQVRSTTVHNCTYLIPCIMHVQCVN